MLLPPLRCLLRSFRFSSSARWLSRCRAAVAVAELFAAAAAGDTVEVLLSSYFIMISVAGDCSCNVVFFVVLVFSSGDSTATATALQSGRSPHGSASSILRTISSPSWAPRRIDTTSSAKIVLMADPAGSVLRSVPAMDLRGWVRASSGKH